MVLISFTKVGLEREREKREAAKIEGLATPMVE